MRLLLTAGTTQLQSTIHMTIHQLWTGSTFLLPFGMGQQRCGLTDQPDLGKEQCLKRGSKPGWPAYPGQSVDLARSLRDSSVAFPKWLGERQPQDTATKWVWARHRAPEKFKIRLARAWILPSIGRNQVQQALTLSSAVFLNPCPMIYTQQRLEGWLLLPFPVWARIHLSLDSFQSLEWMDREASGAGRAPHKPTDPRERQEKIVTDRI